MCTRRSTRALPSARIALALASGDTSLHRRELHRDRSRIHASAKMGCSRRVTRARASYDPRASSRSRSYVRSRRPESNRRGPVWRTDLSPRHTCLAVAVVCATVTWVAEAPRHQAAVGVPSSHPLESNQDLPGFSRTPRPTRREWDLRAARIDAARQIICGLFGCQVARAGRTSGAGATALAAGTPLAWTRSRRSRTHPSRLPIFGRSVFETRYVVRESGL